jgi:hypothetical protein
MRTAHVGAWGWFCAGVLLELTVAVGAFTLGLMWPETLLLIALIVAALRAARLPSARQSMLGLLSGAGAVFLYIAWIERAGPGDGQLNPFPWLLVGIAMFVAGVIAQSRRA